MAILSRLLAWLLCCSSSSRSSNTAAANPTKATKLPPTNNPGHKEVKSMQNPIWAVSKDLPSTNRTGDREVKNLQNSSISVGTDLPSRDKSSKWEVKNQQNSIWAVATERELPSTNQSGNWEVENLQKSTRAVATTLVSANQSGEEEMKTMENCARQRLEQELREINANPPTHCSYGPVDSDIFHWQGTITGPVYTAFEGGIFNLSIRFPIEYPFKPPIIKFLTKVYHPNVGADGTIHMDILRDQWSPALTVEKLLLSICSFLPDPNLQAIHNPDSNLYWHEWKHFDKMAREWTKQYATG